MPCALSCWRASRPAVDVILTCQVCVYSPGGISLFVGWSSTSWAQSRSVFVPVCFIVATGEAKTGWGLQWTGEANSSNPEQICIEMAVTTAEMQAGTRLEAAPLLWPCFYFVCVCAWGGQCMASIVFRDRANKLVAWFKWVWNVIMRCFVKLINIQVLKTTTTKVEVIFSASYWKGLMWYI